MRPIPHLLWPRLVGILRSIDLLRGQSSSPCIISSSLTKFIGKKLVRNADAKIQAPQHGCSKQAGGGGIQMAGFLILVILSDRSHALRHHLTCQATYCCRYHQLLGLTNQFVALPGDQIIDRNAPMTGYPLPTVSFFSLRST